MADSSMDWEEDMSMFNTSASQFDGVFSDFAYDSPAAAIPLQPPSASAVAQHSQHAPVASSASSSQDSASDSSSRRRKRTTKDSESPISDQATEIGKRDVQVKSEMQQEVRSFENTFSQPMHNLSLDYDGNISHFDFSAASSPIQAGDFNTALSLGAHVNMQTINPSMFTIGESRDQSPATTKNIMFNQPSPNALFSTPSSESQEFAHQSWNPSLAHNPSWPGDYSIQLASPGGIAFTPSPANGGTPGASGRNMAGRMDKSPLHIAPISTKSRVETQINVVMTLENPPPGIEHVHLPLHTIAKSKLLAKEDYDKSKVLELHTMLVCTSAMHNPHFKEKALQRAASMNNEDIQKRAELARATGDDEKNDPKNVDEADKPANGGDVRICTNCIQRERKRAGRKKTKREEEQQHWERYETERVVVFNSNEYLELKPCEPGQLPQRDGDSEQYVPPDGALQVTAAMRIACYCRHQSEKEGFQVIFTMMDQQGTVVAQQMSDSILITDDHKTHAQSFSTAVAGDAFYQGSNGLPNNLQMSHSMVDMTAHVQPFPSSRSAGNLQTLYNAAQFNPHSHVHQLPGPGYASQTTSATMTPTSLSRPASPTSTGQVGPNKKRKSSSFHRKVPSGLTMTPRVDTSLPPSSNMPSARSMNSQFSPTNSAFPGQMTQSYMTIPNNNGPAQYFGSGPPTPSESGPFSFGQQQIEMSRMTNNQAYFSHPSSAVPSRSSSPVLQQTRANMAAYARQQPIQTPTNTMSARPNMFVGQAAPGSSGSDQVQASYPIISRITPSEGPVAGGTEVAVLGENFTVGMTVAFGDQAAQTNFISPTSLLAFAPPGRPGNVHLGVIPAPGQERYLEAANKPVYRYVQNNDEMMVMALKFLSEQHQGNVDNWQSFAQQSASQFVQSRVHPAGLQRQGYPSGYRMSTELGKAEETMLLRILDAVDMRESPRPANFELAADNGATMLSLACASGMHRFAAALLARGANVNVQDQGGYTPLMHSAIHGHSTVFRLLVARGADPDIRSLTGYSAVELASAEVRDELLQILLDRRRRRESQPSSHTLPCHGSSTLWKVPLDTANASFDGSEVDSGEQNIPLAAPSRPPGISDLDLADQTTTLSVKPLSLLPDATTAPRRNALAAQIHHFHRNKHHYHMPTLPETTAYRRRSVLVPATASPPTTEAELLQLIRGRAEQRAQHHDDALWDSETTSDAPSAPPAYHDLFPDRKPTSADQGLHDVAVKAAASDTLVDEKHSLMSEAGSDTSCHPSSTPSAVACPDPSQRQAPMPMMAPLMSATLRILARLCASKMSAQENTHMPTSHSFPERQWAST